MADAKTSLMTMKSVIQKYSSDIQQLIPKHVTGERIVLIAQAALTRNPSLLDCDPRTVLAGIIQASILGLELHSALHHACLVPFWNSKAGINEALLMVEYPGLIELVMRGGETSFVESQAVYANDLLDVEYGSNPHLMHKPETRNARGALIGAYAYAKLKSGDTKFHWMSKEDIEKRRNVSKAKDSGPWKVWEEEMYAKTPLRHLCKQLRKNADLAIALEHENRFDQGIAHVVEGGEGLSMDFLSMNVEAKTIEAKESLKGKIAEKSESSKQTAPPAGAKKSTRQEPAPDQSQQALPPDLDMNNLSATPPAQTKSPVSPIEAQGTGGASGTDSGAPPPEMTAEQRSLMDVWDQDGLNYASNTANAPSAPPVQRPSPPAPQAPKATAPARAASSKDPQDQTIEQSEVKDLLAATKSKNIPIEDIRKRLDQFTPKVQLFRNLTVRQHREMMEWVSQK